MDLQRVTASSIMIVGTVDSRRLSWPKNSNTRAKQPFLSIPRRRVRAENAERFVGSGRPEVGVRDHNHLDLLNQLRTERTKTRQASDLFHKSGRQLN
jgi:hypothetical protein